MATVALAFAVLDFGGATDLGIVLLAREIPIVIFLLLGGVFADRLPRRVILVGCDLVKGTAQAARRCCCSPAPRTSGTWACCRPCSASRLPSPALPRRGSSARRSARSGSRRGTRSSALSRNILSIAAPAIGAIIVALGNPALAIGIDAVTFFVSAALVASMHLAPTVRLASKSIVGDLRDGWSEFVERTWVVVMVISFGLFQLTYFPALLVLGPIVAKEELGAPARGGRPRNRIGGCGRRWDLRPAREVRQPTRRQPASRRPRRDSPHGARLPAATALIGVTGFLTGIGFAFGGAIWDATLQRNVPEHALSRISSFDWLGSVASTRRLRADRPARGRLRDGADAVIAGALNIVTASASCWSLRSAGCGRQHRPSRPRPSRPGRLSPMTSPSVAGHAPALRACWHPVAYRRLAPASRSPSTCSASRSCCGATGRRRRTRFGPLHPPRHRALARPVDGDGSCARTTAGGTAPTALCTAIPQLEDPTRVPAKARVDGVHLRRSATG